MRLIFCDKQSEQNMNFILTLPREWKQISHVISFIYNRAETLYTKQKPVKLTVIQEAKAIQNRAST